MCKATVQPKYLTSETTAWQYSLMLSLLCSSPTSLIISPACAPSSIAEASALGREEYFGWVYIQ